MKAHQQPKVGKGQASQLCKVGQLCVWATQQFGVPEGKTVSTGQFALQLKQFVAGTVGQFAEPPTTPIACAAPKVVTVSLLRINFLSRRIIFFFII